jgi:hypothetical protein
MEEGYREESGWVDWKTLGLLCYVRLGSADGCVFRITFHLFPWRGTDEGILFSQFLASPWFRRWNGTAVDTQSDASHYDTISTEICVVTS